ncbi:MAG: hypothetical protein GY793_06415 [Proteobacteria bacterium]|nr:hypothetical protein [Pseudomonadota bacterium]
MDINNLVKHQYQIAIDRSRTIKEQNLKAKQIILRNTPQWWWDKWYSSTESLQKDFDQQSINILTSLTNIVR